MARPTLKESGDCILIQQLRFSILILLLTCVPALVAEPVPVRHMQGTVHGYLALKSPEGKTLAIGELSQVAHADRVVSHLVFHFRDGSVDDETAVYSQHGEFRLISDHHIQKGPSFPKPIDLMVEASGQITSRSLGGDGKEKITQEHTELPPDISNGLVSILLTNINPNDPETRVSMVAPTAKPRLIKLSIKPEGEETFLVGGVRHKATNFRVKIELGGVTGVVAPLVGKEPADTHVWVSRGEAPAFVRRVGPLYDGGPVWITEQISPEFPVETVHKR